MNRWIAIITLLFAQGAIADSSIERAIFLAAICILLGIPREVRHD